MVVVRRGYVHVEVHQLLVFSLARVQPDEDIAREALNREALGREPRPVSRARGEHADAVGVRERAGLDDVERHPLDLRKRGEARRKDVAR